VLIVPFLSPAAGTLLIGLKPGRARHDIARLTYYTPAYRNRPDFTRFRQRMDKQGWFLNKMQEAIEMCA
jgi:hypothetical protein